jgi:IS30 family transposase
MSNGICEWNGHQNRLLEDCVSSIQNIAFASKVFIDSFTIPKFYVRKTLFQCFLELTESGITGVSVRRTECPKIPERKSILERPEAVQRRKQAGHWETDTVIARSSNAALLVTVGRKSRYTKLARLKRRTAQQFRISLNRTLSQYKKHLRRTITYDSGLENVEHMIVDQTLGTRSYFCQPYHSWEKGTVEDTIGSSAEPIRRKQTSILSLLLM